MKISCGWDSSFVGEKMSSRVLLILSFSLLLTSCGEQVSQSQCNPNYASQGFSAYVEFLQGTSYRFTICTNSDYQGSVFTVYGVASQEDIATMDLETRKRLAHVSDASQPGSNFPVTFESSDTWFIIYEDQEVGGTFELSNSVEMLRGNLML